MQTLKTNKFLSDWGFHAVLVAVTLPILGLAYLAWTVTVPHGASNVALLQAEPVRWTASDVITAFQSVGLSAEVVRGATKDERDIFSHLMVVDAHRFRVGEGEAEMGMVLNFENRRDLVRMQKYYLALNDSLPQFRSWIFVKDNILLQINHEVPEDTARAYADVLETLDW